MSDDVSIDRHRFWVLAVSVDLAINVIFARYWYVVTSVGPYRERAFQHCSVVDFFYAQHCLKRQLSLKAHVVVVLD
jgi:hypothetical protein